MIAAEVITMVWVTAAEHVDGYRIRLRFNDGVEGVVDLRETIRSDSRELFRQLTAPGEFEKFRVESDTVVWENGLDLAPEFLYELADKSA